MAFEKGISGNPHGRKPGTANKATQTVRDKFAQLLDGYSLEQMQADLLAIDSPKERLSILAGLAEFVTPKLSRTALNNDAEPICTVEDARAALLRRLIAQRSA